MQSSPTPVVQLPPEHSAGGETVLPSCKSEDVFAGHPGDACFEEGATVNGHTITSIKEEQKIFEDSTEALKEEPRPSRSRRNMSSPPTKCELLEARSYKALPTCFTTSSLGLSSREETGGQKKSWDYRRPYTGGCDEFVLNNPPHGVGFYTFTNDNGNIGTRLGDRAYHYQNVATDGGFYIKNRDGSSYHYSPRWGGTCKDKYGD